MIAKHRGGGGGETAPSAMWHSRSCRVFRSSRTSTGTAPRAQPRRTPPSKRRTGLHSLSPSRSSNRRCPVGDEGKGKVVDLLAEQADLVIRFQGGNTSATRSSVEGETFKFH